MKKGTFQPNSRRMKKKHGFFAHNEAGIVKKSVDKSVNMYFILYHFLNCIRMKLGCRYFKFMVGRWYYG